MRRVRAWIITALLVVLLVKVLWITVEPMIPYLVLIAILVGIVSFVFKRTTRL